MKTIAEISKPVGGDGAQVHGGLYIAEKNLKMKVECDYPLEKILEPATKAIDSALAKLEKVIPGDQTALLEKVKADYKRELIEFLGE